MTPRFPYAKSTNSSVSAWKRFVYFFRAPSNLIGICYLAQSNLQRRSQQKTGYHKNPKFKPNGHYRCCGLISADMQLIFSSSRGKYEVGAGTPVLFITQYFYALKDGSVFFPLSLCVAFGNINQQINIPIPYLHACKYKLLYEIFTLRWNKSGKLRGDAVF